VCIVHGWGVLAGCWPVGSGLLDDVAQGQGLTAAAHRLRWARKDHIVVADTGAIPTARKYRRRFSCSQLHPGLCYHHDAVVYHQVREAARGVERALASEDVFSYFMFSDSDHTRVEVLFFALMRARRPYAKQTHIFVRCDQTQAGAQQLVSLRNRPECAMYDFASVWMVVKPFIDAGSVCD
jgi:hypothetical protein